MFKTLCVLIALPFIGAGLASFAQGPTGKIAFVLDSDRYHLEYVHTGDDVADALDQGMLLAAEFFLKRGLVDFYVEDAFIHKPVGATTTASLSRVYCGTYVCAAPLPLNRVPARSKDQDTNEILVVLELAGPNERTAASALSFNVEPLVSVTASRTPKALF